MEPWGTPQHIGAIEEDVLYMSTEEVQMFKYDYNHYYVLNAIPHFETVQWGEIKYSS